MKYFELSKDVKNVLASVDLGKMYLMQCPLLTSIFDILRIKSEICSEYLFPLLDYSIFSLGIFGDRFFSNPFAIFFSF